MKSNKVVALTGVINGKTNQVAGSSSRDDHGRYLKSRTLVERASQGAGSSSCDRARPRPSGRMLPVGRAAAAAAVGASVASAIGGSVSVTSSVGGGAVVSSADHGGVDVDAERPDAAATNHQTGNAISTRNMSNS